MAASSPDAGHDAILLTDANSVATPATSRISNTSANTQNKLKRPSIMSVQEHVPATLLDEEDDGRLEQLLQEAELLAARMRTTVGSSDSSTNTGEVGDFKRDTSMTMSEAMLLESTDEGGSIGPDERKSDILSAAANSSSAGSTRPRRSSRSSSSLLKDSSTHSRSQQDQVDAAIHSSRLMEKALQALSQSQRDIGAASAEPDQETFVSTEDDVMLKATAAMKLDHHNDSVIWDKVDFAQEDDEDYAPIVDYSRGPFAAKEGSSNGKSNRNSSNSSPSKQKPALTSSYIDKTSGITWHKLDSPSHDDEDFVPLADYSNTSKQSSPTSTDSQTLLFSPLTRQELYRRKTALRRRKRNKWILRILLLLSLLVGICFLLGLLAGEEVTDESPTKVREDGKPKDEPSRKQRHVDQQLAKENAKHLRVEHVVKDIKERFERPASKEKDSHTMRTQGTASVQLKSFSRSPSEQAVESTSKDAKEINEPNPSILQSTAKNVPQPLVEQASDTSTGSASVLRTNGAKDGPCDTRIALGSSNQAASSGEDDSSAIAACSMAFADWLLPICRRSRSAGSDPTHEDKVYALVQSMMQ